LWWEYSTYTNYTRFCEKFTLQKSSAPFLLFLGKSGFCYVIFNSHMFNAPRFNSENDVSLQNFFTLNEANTLVALPNAWRRSVRALS
jgi:hypothetical protein